MPYQLGKKRKALAFSNSERTACFSGPQEGGLVRYTWRFYTIIVLFLLFFLALLYRVYNLTVVQHDFLMSESEKRSLRVDSVPVHRAMLTDREGIPLMISIPAVSIWMNPQEITHFEAYDWQALSDALGVSVPLIRNKIEAHRHKQFIYLKRRLPPNKPKRLIH